MAITALETTFKSVINRGGPSAYHVVEAKALAATAVTYTAAPAKMKLVRAAFCNGATVQAAANNYRVGIVNASQSDEVLIDSTVNSANDFGGTAYTGAFVAAYGNANCTLGTAANLIVEEGDILETTLTVEGTVTDAIVVLYFEVME